MAEKAMPGHVARMGRGCGIGLCVAPQRPLAFGRTKGVHGRAKVGRRFFR
jgi:hypothetical protein